ncbi:MAG: linear amide C-N hydrolase [Bacteroidales bacterium]|nr:linear amide C-N hydrolase [Bacteroidales bacterium]
MRVFAGILLFAGLFHFSGVNACTAFYIKTKNAVLIGNNEDGSNPETRIWVEPAGEGRYGRLYFGFSDLSPQGGINEKGLWFDAFGLPFETPSEIKGEVYPGDLQDKILAECSTVEEVAALLKRYNRSQMNRYQWMIGDKNGNSAIVEDDTILFSNQNLQVVTNFRQSNFPDGKGYECLRYQTAMKILKSDACGSVDDVRKILSATHSEGEDVTLYSYIADLTHGKVYVYNFHNYEDVVILDINEEINKGKHVYSIHDLFPLTVAAEVFNYRLQNDLNQKIESRRFKNFDNSTLVNYCGRYQITSPAVMAGQTLHLTTEKEYIKPPVK